MRAAVERPTLRARRRSSQLVATWHGVYSSDPLRRRFNGMLLRASRLILPSSFVWTHLQREYPAANCAHWRLIHRGVSGVDLPFELGATPQGNSRRREQHHNESADGDAVILLPGRLSRSKGQEPFLAALARLPSEISTDDGARLRPIGRLIGAKPASLRTTSPSHVRDGLPSTLLAAGRHLHAAVGRRRLRYEDAVAEAIDAARRAGATVVLEPHTSAMQVRSRCGSELSGAPQPHIRSHVPLPPSRWHRSPHRRCMQPRLSLR